MPQNNQNQKGFANIAVLIIFLLTMGGTVLYFKKFPLTSVPVGGSRTQVEKEVGVATSSAQNEHETCKELMDKYAKERDTFLNEINAKKKEEFTPEEDEKYRDMEKRGKVLPVRCKEFLNPAQVRDQERLGDKGQIQVSLEMYYDACNSYPVAPALVNVGSSQFDTSFNVCPNGKSTGIFHTKLFSSGLKSKGADFQYCSEESRGLGKCGVTKNGNALSYHLVFTLESDAGLLLSGQHTATPLGVK